MRVTLHMENNQPILLINGKELRLSAQEFDRLFAEMRWVARTLG